MCHPPWLSRLSPRQAMVYMTCRVNHTLRISARCPYVKSPADKVMSLVRAGLK